MTVFSGLLPEQPFALTVNGRNLLSILMLPENLEEFARGYLATEAIIPSDEIESVMIDHQTISVLTTNPFKVLLPKRAVISGCGGTASYLDPAKLPVLGKGITASSSLLAAEFPSNILALGGYSAATRFFDGATFLASDLSQHTALDKVTGLVLKNGRKPADAILLLSGKVTADTVRKTLNAGYSILSSCQPPTALAVELADSCNLTLICLPEKVYTHSERIR
ncbi:formate dehydrogenase accessory sulfurtransferase FdhD [Methanorbis furvi]|uniref:Sulfur carrier protein FdhD n=1 Tax=Methanorbis furvi TaxID=3028299 RepID=A0AAE4SB94_9EURY|nr:Sulfur carrier protein FdhD [Methanocorpusculaceae archaeon Ag1]